MGAELKIRTVKSVSWNLIGRMGVFGMNIILGIILARLLTPKDYGLIGLIAVFFSISAIFINSGLGMAYIRKKTVNDTDANTVFFINLVISLVIYILLWFFAPVIASFYDQPILVELTRVYGFIVIINAFRIIQDSQIRRELNFKKRTKFTLLSTLISGIAGITSAYYGLGVWSLVIQQLLNSFILTFGLAVTNTWKPSFNFSKDSMTSMFNFGSWVLFNGLMREIFRHIYVLIIGKFFPIAQAGFYTQARDFERKITTGISMSVVEVSDLLKGAPKSKIEITVQRGGNSAPVTRIVEREEVRINNVAWYGEVEEGIGYIQFNGFTEDAYQEVKDALIDLKENYGIESLILDVRGNPGGLLIEAVNITNLFVDKGQEIVSTRGKVKQWDHVYKARNNPVDAKIPLVILVGRGSASASEIVAGAIQDLDRGLVIGQRTFGKGLIQTTRQLSYNAQLKITTAKYYTPSGRSIQAYDFTEEGGVAYPDSLISEFKTLNGRKVFDGGGINPDIEVMEERPAPIVINLYTGNHFFNYATRFKEMNETIPAISEFVITDDEYRRFIEYLESEEFDYETQTEERFRQLVMTAKQEKYFDPLQDMFTSLEDKIAHDKENDLEKFKKEIKNLLREEIISRYHYQKGRAEASLNDDAYLKKAIDVLNNKILYNSVLDGKQIYASDEAKGLSLMSFSFLSGDMQI